MLTKIDEETLKLLGIKNTSKYTASHLISRCKIFMELESVDSKEITRKYHLLAKKYHTDKNKELIDNNMFVALNTAKSVISAFINNDLYTYYDIPSEDLTQKRNKKIWK